MNIIYSSSLTALKKEGFAPFGGKTKGVYSFSNYDTIPLMTRNLYPISDHALIEITKRCNYSCLHCFTNASKKELAEKQQADYDSLFKELPLVGVQEVTISGGEASIRKDYLEIVKSAATKGLKTNLFTTGFRVTDSDLEALFPICSTIALSIDGDKDHHNWLRNKPKAFDEIAGFLDRLLGRGFKVFVQSMVTSRNIRAIQQTVDFLVAKGIRSFSLTHVSPQGRAGKTHPELFLNQKEMDYLFQLVTGLKPHFDFVGTNLVSRSSLNLNRSRLLKPNLHVVPNGSILPWFGVPERFRFCEFDRNGGIQKHFDIRQNGPFLAELTSLFEENLARGLKHPGEAVPLEDMLYELCAEVSRGPRQPDA